MTTPMIDRAGLPGISRPSRQLSRLNSSLRPTSSVMTAEDDAQPSLEM